MPDAAAQGLVERPKGLDFVPLTATEQSSRSIVRVVEFSLHAYLPAEEATVNVFNTASLNENN